MSDFLDESWERESAISAEMRREFAGVAEVQRIERHSAQATRPRVTATVDGTGRVLSLDIEDQVLRRGHPDLLGAAIVEAVGAARTRAALRAKELIMPILSLDAGQPAAPLVVGEQTPLSPARAPAWTRTSRSTFSPALAESGGTDEP